jgi:hypothetical protein
MVAETISQVAQIFSVEIATKLHRLHYASATFEVIAWAFRFGVTTCVDFTPNA